MNSDFLNNIQDVMLIISYCIDNYYHGLGDINDDEIVNILDVVQLVNIILN